MINLILWESDVIDPDTGNDKTIRRNETVSVRMAEEVLESYMHMF